MEKVEDSRVLPKGLIKSVNWEINRGIQKWGDVDKDPPDFLIAITEELGEVAHAINHKSGNEKARQEIAEVIALLVRLHEMLGDK